MSNNEFNLAKEVLDNSGVIAFPTETVMGLGVYYNDHSAYQFLNKIKNRPEDKPYTLMLGNVGEIFKYALLSERDIKVIMAFMPGELTVLLKSKENVPSYVTHGTGVIGIRVPNMPHLCEFLNYIKTPLLVPSANKSGEKPAMSSTEVKNIFNNEIGFIFEGVAIGGIPSTIVDLTGEEVKIVREGNITLDDIKRVLPKGDNEYEHCNW